ncbi:MAG TPA: XRE family transcriptional regulator [Gammaproteobacteria bacterium]|nr:XRE family transcriptional regulator [Gammaproteobacteria bacterium]
MRDSIEYIAQHLKKARESQGLSQRELSTKSGVPQGHISKIENGSVDLRLSSLVALARVLELELTLIPRKFLGVVNAVISDAPSRFEGGPPRPAYHLDEDEA